MHTQWHGVSGSKWALGTECSGREGTAPHTVHAPSVGSARAVNGQWALIAMGIRALFEPWKPTCSAHTVQRHQREEGTSAVASAVARAGTVWAVEFHLTHATVSVSVKPMRTTSDLVGPEVLRAPPAAVRGVTTTL